MKISIISSHKNEKALNLEKILLEKYLVLQSIESISAISSSNPDVLIVLGGDGFMLRVLHKIVSEKKDTHVYGINCGNVGFLLNNFVVEKDDLMLKIENAIAVKLSPLQIHLEDRAGKTYTIHAINEISLIRQTYQAVNLKVSIDDKIKIHNLVGDGILFSTSAGSAAYNFSAGGVILPLESNLLTVTAINPFRPKRWKYAILNPKSSIEFEVLDYSKRPVLACADFQQFYFIRLVKAKLDSETTYSILFDEESHLADKLMDEQFTM